MMNPELIDWLLWSSLQLALVISLVLLLRRSVARYLGAGFAYALWALPPLVLLTGLLPRPEAVLYPAPQWLAVPQMEVLVVTAGQATASGLSATTWMLVAWAAVAGLLLLRLMADAWHGRRLLKGNAGFFASEHGIAYLNASAPCPMTVGWWRPRIVLPVDFSATVPASRQSLIIAHEACHARRKDNLANLLARVLCCLFWFHPLVHVGWRFFQIDQELSCDAHVLARAGASARRDYGHALLAIGAGDGGACLRLHAAWSSSMKERIMMLKHHRKSWLRTSAGYLLLAILTGLVSMASLAGPAEQGLTPANSASLLQQQALPATAPETQAERQVGGVGNTAAIAQAALDAGSKPEHDRPISEIRVSYRQTSGSAGPAPSAVSPGQPQRAAAVSDQATGNRQSVVADRPPRPVDRVNPRYPRSAWGKGIEGSVTLEFYVTASGEVEDVQVVKALPHPRLFDDAAIAALERWQFEPATQGGKPVKARTRQTIDFRLQRSERVLQPWDWKRDRQELERKLAESKSK